MNKYELIKNDFKEIFGIKLFRIRAFLKLNNKKLAERFGITDKDVVQLKAAIRPLLFK